MSSTPQPTCLAELLAELDWSQLDLAAESHLSLGTVARAVHGEQVIPRTRARIVAALNHRRAARGLSELRASEVFPVG